MIDILKMWSSSSTSLAIRLVLLSTLLHFFVSGLVDGDNTHHDFFKKHDLNNDSSLSMLECKSAWLSLDADHDSALDKVEFLLQWTFNNFQDAPHAPLFFRLIDNDFNSRISEKEIGQLCLFFDDDEDGSISEFEMDLNWKGLFSTM